eukprot:1919179-Rhodomonas_salina.2
MICPDATVSTREPAPCFQLPTLPKTTSAPLADTSEIARVSVSDVSEPRSPVMATDEFVERSTLETSETVMVLTAPGSGEDWAARATTNLPSSTLNAAASPACAPASRTNTELPAA